MVSQSNPKCSHCGNVIRRSPSQLKRKHIFCNRNCYLMGIRNNSKLASNWRGKRVEFNCKVCQTLCNKRTYGKYEPKYCSLKCAAIDRGVAQSGSNHWNWKGGKDTRYLKKIAPRPKPERCEVCNRQGLKRNGICLDHNHTNGHFRGWLCSNCNTALGLLNEDINILNALANYIKSNQ
jgi:endogenous inhibitor of DNA gyrase (YacG/DUF329 family)